MHIYLPKLAFLKNKPPYIGFIYSMAYHRAQPSGKLSSHLKPQHTAGLDLHVGM